MSGAALIIAAAAIEKEAAEAQATVADKQAAIDALPEHGDPGRADLNSQMLALATQADELCAGLAELRQKVAAL